uniref:G-protein coupled receptors family 1 profile domain-containing protein n=1 Tax=Naja naja TaxID=35670 RepID=A0A8C7E0N9_NAJNA
MEEVATNVPFCTMDFKQANASICWPSMTGDGPERVIIPVLFGLIFLLGMVGNTLVLVVLGRLPPGGRPSRSATNIFILNLSIADFSFLLFCVPFQATIYSLPEWVFGAFLCKWVHYLVMATMLVSIFTLVAMSVDRYIAVVHAKRSLCIRSKRNAILGVAIIWFLSLLFAIPVAEHQELFNGQQQAPNSSFCWELWPGNPGAKQMYKVTIFVVGYLLPLVLITCCYTKRARGIQPVLTSSGEPVVEILSSLKNRPLTGPANPISSLPPIESQLNGWVFFGCPAQENGAGKQVLYHLHKKVKNISRKSARSKRKTAQTVLLVVAVFLISWLPHHIITIWVEFGQFPLNNISFTFRIISHCLAYGNSCINPIIYAFLSENFRNACRQVFTCKLLLQPARADKLVRVRMENFSTTHSTTNV